MEDSQIDPEVFVITGENIKDFQKCVKDIIEAIQADEDFSKATSEKYDNKKGYLRKHLDELSRLHQLFADQHIQLIEKVSKNLHQHPSDSASTCSAVKDDGSKLKDAITGKYSLVVNEAKVVELQNQVTDLKLVISESDLKNKTMEEELVMSRKKLSVANNLIQNLKGVHEENRKLKQEHDKTHNKLIKSSEVLFSLVKDMRERNEQLQLIIAAHSEQDDKIKDLETKNNGYKSEIKRLEEMMKSKEGIYNQVNAKLKGQLKTQTKSTDQLKKQLRFSWSERNKISGKLESVEEEKTSKENLVKELEARLNRLQAEHVRAVPSFENMTKQLNFSKSERKRSKIKKDSKISPEISTPFGKTNGEFQECVKDIIEKIDLDEPFSKMTAKSYDQKKCCLRSYLKELLILNKLLVNQHLQLVKRVNRNCPSLLQKAYQHPSDSASTSLTVKHDAVKKRKISGNISQDVSNSSSHGKKVYEDLEAYTRYEELVLQKVLKAAQRQKESRKSS